MKKELLLLLEHENYTYHSCTHTWPP